MTLTVGIGLAFVAMLSWGFGDFIIQREVKKIGDWETLFVITFFGTVVLLPFVYKDIPGLFSSQIDVLYILISAGIILLCASLFCFEALKKGKLSVLEPILSLEIPAAAFLAFFVLGDHVTGLQTVVIIFLVIGLCLVSFREKNISKKFFLEKGIFIFFVGAFLMGAGDFLLGWGARATNALIGNFVINVTMVIVTGIYLISRGQAHRAIRDIAANRKLLLVMSIADNAAWISFAFAMTLVPIAVATGLSESSIIIAVILGFGLNHEKLQRHQKVGLVVALASAVALAVLTT